MGLIEKFGIAGFAVLVLWAVWNFLEKWAGKFYDVQAKQAEAMAILATRVSETSSDQRDMLIVGRSISASVERLHGELSAAAAATSQVFERLGSVERKLGDGKWIGGGGS